MTRIELLASLCSGSECVCDVGCDHAYVLTKALTKYNAKRGIAADIAAGPLSAARESIVALRLENRVSMVLSNGFIDIHEEFDTAVVAGMGGHLIATILENSLDKLRNKKLILEANNDRMALRSFLMTHGFSIEDEYSIYDSDKYYEVFVVETKEAHYTERELYFGPILLQKREEDFLAFYRKKSDMLKNIIQSVKTEEVRREKEAELSMIESVLLG